MSLMLKFSWEMLFFESGDTEVFKADRSKLFASNERQIDNHTLMLDMLHSNMSVVCTYHSRGVFKKIFFLLHEATFRVQHFLASRSDKCSQIKMRLSKSATNYIVSARIQNIHGGGQE